MKISKEEYAEYQTLLKKSKYIYSRDSAKSIKSLEDDIDLPIKDCVAMLALIGCEPVFSCCGFDYDGQPLHKSHQLGYPYVRLTDNLYSEALLTSPFKQGWTAKIFGSQISLELNTSMNPHWRKASCIHYSEEAVIGIQYLENLLHNNKHLFNDFVVLKDTNASHASELKFWQYPPKTPWTIYKEDYI
ncbi:hypothetical protein HN960_05150 [Candidatus Peregrinibacteria bacterium]|nr:hypothetical protein [Candidatus Peregrinibacteria bacterium]MBT7009792.1 hypothetical protein [Candidatus Peregrinibacteria bacterium]